MKKNAIKNFAVLTVLAIATSFVLSVSAATYIGRPQSFAAVYNDVEETMTYSGTYTGTIQPTRMYMITLLDAKGALISTRNPMGSELDKGNGYFEYSFTLDNSALADFTQPFKATFTCMTANVLQPIEATAIVTGGAKFNVSFVAGEGGTLSSGDSLKVDPATHISTLEMPTPIPLEGYEFDRWEATSSSVQYDFIVADITFTAHFKKATVIGDVTGDGVADNMDAARILRYDAGLISEIDEAAGDVNGDGVVDNVDASMILKYDAGLLDNLG